MAEKKESKEKEPKEELQAVPISRALSPFEEMDRLFESLFPHRWLQPFRWEIPSWTDLKTPETRMPKVDIIDRDEEVIVRAEIPGVAKEDLDVSMTGNSVTIKGSTTYESKQERGNYYRCEISRGSFSRTFALPSDVDVDRAKAVFRDGILELSLPKIEHSKRRSITID